MQLFLKNIFFFSLVTVVVFGLFGVVNAWLQPDFKAKQKILYDYQIDKIAVSTGTIDTIFVGDSSLGNAIDAEFYSELSGDRSLNLALTGLFGYGGTYNMIKRAVDEHPTIKRIYVFQTIDLMTRPISYKGYAVTMKDIDAVWSLSFPHNMYVLQALFDFRTALTIGNWLSNMGAEKEVDFEKYDFITNPHEPNKDFNGITIHNSDIQEDKLFFLKKIIDFAHKKNIQVVYIHGPMLDETVHRSTAYVDRVNLLLQNNGVEKIVGPIPVPAEDLSGTPDHIHFSVKKIYTQKYFEAIAL